jgi:hypothetical protein
MSKTIDTVTHEEYDDAGTRTAIHTETTTKEVTDVKTTATTADTSTATA